MSPVKTLVRSSIFAGTLTIIFLASTNMFGQSTDPAHPTPITAFPVTGNLGSGTYYYSMPKSLLAAGPANAGLDMTPPDGGGSMTVTFSGRGCCPPEAYIGVTTGLSERIHQATTFNIPGLQQSLLVTVYVSVGAGQTVSFRLIFANQGTSGGVVVTPPPSTSTTPTPTEPVCTDLGLRGFSVSPVTSMSNKISGSVVNITTTHPYKGYEHRQWVEVRDIGSSETRPPLVGRIWLPAILDPGRSFPFAVLHTLAPRHRTPRYEVRIIYSPQNPSDESQYNDDCRAVNNSTRRQLIAAPLDEGELEPVPKQP